MNAFLEVLGGGAEPGMLRIEGSELRIGRAEDCELRCFSSLISRHHCALRTEGETVFVEDLGSQNGTFLNGERIVGERELKDGDTLMVAFLPLRVHIDPTLPGNGGRGLQFCRRVLRRARSALSSGSDWE